MPVDVLQPGRMTGRPGPAPTWRCALVNNMPDAALEQTDRQFLALIDAGTGDRTVAVRRYGLAGVPRGPRAEAYLQAEYLPVEGLWADEPDAVIITGSEPRSASLAAEPYWDDFVALLRRAMARRTAVLLSCLSAHAALLALDGLERTPLPSKCFGVFAHDVRTGAAMTTGLAATVTMPHSRLNGVDTAAVAAAGWDVLCSSPVGWGAVAARRGEADLLLVQGHPEYDPGTLLREWRRDLGRWLRAERPDVPAPPVGAVAPCDRNALADLERGLRTGGRVEGVLDGFDFDGVGARAEATWRPAAEVLYANWIDGVVPRLPARGDAMAAGD